MQPGNSIMALAAGELCSACGVGVYHIHERDLIFWAEDDALIVRAQVAECRVCHDVLLDAPTSGRIGELAEALRAGDKTHLASVGVTYRASL